MHARGRLRIEESVGEARALRGEVTAWRARWDTIDAMGGHLTQLDTLCAVVAGLVGEIETRTTAIDLARGVGEVYEECRAADLRVLHTRRLWRWYADKLDQRAGPADDVESRTLRAADEVIWSCWKTAFTTLGESMPAVPVAYLAPLFSASATPRADPPDGLRPGTDDLLRTHIERLPVAVVGLPPVCCRRPWWLILGAHEASHHVQFEAPGLEQRTQDQVVAAAYSVTADVELAEAWRPWCRELFADACSVLLAGPAAIWAVSELETRTAEGMRTSVSGRYPPALLRLAVLRAVASRAGLEAAEPDPSQTEAGDRLRRLLDCVPAVAEALLGLTPASGRPLRSLSGAVVAAFASGGLVAGWRSELLGREDPVPRRSLDAARFCAAAGVLAWQRVAATDGGGMVRLASRLLSALALCHEPGTRAMAPVRDVGDVTRRFIGDLYTGGEFR